MPSSPPASLRDSLHAAANPADRFLWGAEAGISLDALRHATSLRGRLPELAGRSVLVATADQLATAVALIELDGIVRRLVLCPPDVASADLPAVIEGAGSTRSSPTAPSCCMAIRPSRCGSPATRT